MNSVKKKYTPFRPSNHFPSVDTADDSGLLGIGGKLTPDWLLDAYTHGIFPWPFQMSWVRRELVLGWFSLDPRGIFDFDQFHVSRRLARTCRSGRFRITGDTDFRGVIQACAVSEHHHGGTWITPEMLNAYVAMHDAGHAHSVEAWLDNRLVGGVYGVALNGFFAAESMFHLETDASKVALVALVRHLRKQGFLLLDIQMITEHTATFGAVEIPRNEYLQRLDAALQCDVKFGKLDTPFRDFY